MEAGLHIDRSGKFAISRPDPDLVLGAFINVVKVSVRRAKRLGLDGLVVVMPDVKGFLPPDVMARKDMVTEWAASAQDEMITEWGRLTAGSMKLVLVVPENYIDRERIGVAIARIHGLAANVVPTEREAFDWLAHTKLPPNLPRLGPFPPHHRHR
ncbi:hypothetical protein [Lysobacter niastensis]|uniref:Uncharacterized protein n=1 Tax=Lysobacter niastensis TaxID=380629 RepID=A0ABS0B5N5_9GAMM|nr:hypothetical protein [Lysobacter niastensis]MBF6024143.1 hypothetical protein [Lysobacter niastensis]